MQRKGYYNWRTKTYIPNYVRKREIDAYLNNLAEIKAMGDKIRERGTHLMTYEGESNIN